LLSEAPSLKELAGHEGDLLGLAFSPDGRWLASGARGESFVQLWDTDGYAPAARLRLGGSEDSPGLLRFSPDSRYLSAGLGRRPMIWDVKSRRLRFDSYAERGGGADSIAFSRDGATLYGLRVAAGPWSGEKIDIDVWARPAADLKGTKPSTAAHPGPWPILSEPIPCPFWHDAAIVGEAADGTILLRCTLGLMGDGPLRKTRKFSFRLSTATGHLGRLDPKTLPLASAAVSPDGRSLVVPASGGRLKCFDLSADPPSAIWNCTLAGGKAAEVLAHSGCSRYLAVADAEGVVRILDAAGGGELSSLDWGQGKGKSRAKVRALALSAGGELLAIGGTRRTITVVERMGP
jgi:WD40 repeat protein